VYKYYGDYRSPALHEENTFQGKLTATHSVFTEGNLAQTIIVTSAQTLRARHKSHAMHDWIFNYEMVKTEPKNRKKVE
jgi:hypothetical protein